VLAGSAKERSGWVARGGPRRFLTFLLRGDIGIIALAAFAFYVGVGPDIDSLTGSALSPLTWGAIGGVALLAECVGFDWWMTGAVILEPSRIRVSSEGVELRVGLFADATTPRKVLWSQFRSPPSRGRPGYVLASVSTLEGNRSSQVIFSVQQFRVLWNHPNRPARWTSPDGSGLAGSPVPAGPI
jgi:hypothetical protein